MSKVAIKGADTGTGVFTIESPATNTDRILTLPDEAGALATEAYVGTQALGVGQTWQAPSRASGVTYTNTTGRPIMVIIRTNNASTSISDINILVGGVIVASVYTGVSTGAYSLSAIVPDNTTYALDLGATGSYDFWLELR